MSLNIVIYGSKYSEICSDIISKSISGFFVQKWSDMGASYLKADKTPILDRSQLTQPDFILLLDESELSRISPKSLPKACIVIINSQNKVAPKSLKKYRIKTILIDATAIAIAHTGEPNPSAPMIAALVKKTNCISLKNLEIVLKAGNVKDGSIAAAEEAHKLVK